MPAAVCMLGLPAGGVWQKDCASAGRTVNPWCSWQHLQMHEQCRTAAVKRAGLGLHAYIAMMLKKLMPAHATP
jgi:hypothetical protein